MNGLIRKLFNLLLLSVALTGVMAWTAQATPMTTTVTGVVTKAPINNSFGLFSVGDRIFAMATYEDSLISTVGQSLLTVDTDPSFGFTVMAGPSYRLELADFSQDINFENRSPELTFQDGLLAGISFTKRASRFDLPNSLPLRSFGKSFNSVQFHAIHEFSVFLEGEWDFSTAKGGPTGNTPVPEPSTLLLFGSGLVGVVVWRWRKTQLSLTS